MDFSSPLCAKFRGKFPSASALTEHWGKPASGLTGKDGASSQWQEDQLTHKQFGDHQGKLLREKIEAMMVAKCRAFRPQTHKNIPERANVELHKCFHVSSTRF